MGEGAYDSGIAVKSEGFPFGWLSSGFGGGKEGVVGVLLIPIFLQKHYTSCLPPGVSSV